MRYLACGVWGGFGRVDKAFGSEHSCHQHFTAYYMVGLGLILLTAMVMMQLS